MSWTWLEMSVVRCGEICCASAVAANKLEITEYRHIRMERMLKNWLNILKLRNLIFHYV